MNWDDSAPPEDYVALLAESDKKRGVTYRHTSWTDSGAKLDAQEKARVALALDWADQRGHCPKFRCIDGFIIREYDLAGNQVGIKIRWHKTQDYLMDRIDMIVARFRRWRDRGKNPYGEF